MRPMKSNGGLTHGRGMSDNSLARWTAAMPYSVAVIDAIEAYTGHRSVSSYQHTDLSESKRNRDNRDLHIFTTWLTENCPFTMDNTHLVSLVFTK